MTVLPTNIMQDVLGDTIGQLIGRGHNLGRCLEEMHFPGNNLQQQFLLLLLTACRGHSGVNNSPFRASPVVRGMSKYSRIKYTGHASQRRVCHKHISLISLSYERTSYRHASHRRVSHGLASCGCAILVFLSRGPVSLSRMLLMCISQACIVRLPCLSWPHPELRPRPTGRPIVFPDTSRSLPLPTQCDQTCPPFQYVITWCTELAHDQRKAEASQLK